MSTQCIVRKNLGSRGDESPHLVTVTKVVLPITELALFFLAIVLRAQFDFYGLPGLAIKGLDCASPALDLLITAAGLVFICSLWEREHCIRTFWLQIAALLLMLCFDLGMLWKQARAWAIGLLSYMTNYTFPVFWAMQALECATIACCCAQFLLALWQQNDEKTNLDLTVLRLPVTVLLAFSCIGVGTLGYHMHARCREFVQEEVQVQKQLGAIWPTEEVVHGRCAIGGIAMAIDTQQHVFTLRVAYASTAAGKEGLEVGDKMKIAYSGETKLMTNQGALINQKIDEIIGTDALLVYVSVDDSDAKDAAAPYVAERILATAPSEFLGYATIEDPPAMR